MLQYAKDVGCSVTTNFIFYLKAKLGRALVKHITNGTNEVSDSKQLFEELSCVGNERTICSVPTIKAKKEEKCVVAEKEEITGIYKRGY